ncbi:MAG: diphthine synthase [Thermoplasmata archaeon]|nr:diphthine synthase [Thermoplasmata archaeon]MCI4359190.1 diphthine synthase [Thermoplasmata archaeon]
MGELWFIGAGLSDERDLSRRALDALRSCSAVFAESYTSVLSPGSFDRLAAEIGRPIVVLTRTELESETQILAALDSSPRVALLVPGDPFAATTHVSLRESAEKAGHAWRYLPNASIATAAAGFLGLMSYRFGRITSLPFPEPGFAPTSPLEAIRSNRSVGLHSLVLLDLRPAEQKFLTAGEGLRLLGEREEPGTLPAGGGPVAVVARIGSESARAWYGPRRELEGLEFGPPLHAIVIPAPDLHFEERSALERFRTRGPERHSG